MAVLGLSNEQLILIKQLVEHYRELLALAKLEDKTAEEVKALVDASLKHRRN